MRNVQTRKGDKSNEMRMASWGEQNLKTIFMAASMVTNQSPFALELVLICLTMFSGRSCLPLMALRAQLPPSPIPSSSKLKNRFCSLLTRESAACSVTFDSVRMFLRSWRRSKRMPLGTEPESMPETRFTWIDALLMVILSSGSKHGRPPDEASLMVEARVVRVLVAGKVQVEVGGVEKAPPELVPMETRPGRTKSSGAHRRKRSTHTRGDSVPQACWSSSPHFLCCSPPSRLGSFLLRFATLHNTDHSPITIRKATLKPQMSVFPKAQEHHTTSTVMLSWEEIGQETGPESMQIDHLTDITQQRAHDSRTRTLFSQAGTQAERIDVDDLFNTDCILEPPHRSRDLLPPSKATHQSWK